MSMSAQLRTHFSFFDSQSSMHANNCVYLDSAATTQKLNSVVARQADFMRSQNASVHRGAYPLANEATAMFERAREDIADYIHAQSNEVIFTSGATESINLIAQGMHQDMLRGNTILICESEHHANILPWQQLAKRLGLKIKILKLGQHGTFNQQVMQTWLEAMTEDVAIFACAHVSNVLGNVYPVQTLCQKARSVEAISVIDGTQAIAHLPCNMQTLDCDFYVFSGHKMYAPNGIGVCWGRYNLLEQLSPSKLGGEMIQEVSFESFTTQSPPLKFEAGTPNVAGVLGLHEAVIFLQATLPQIMTQERALWLYLQSKLAAISDIQLLGNTQGVDDDHIVQVSLGIASFYAPEHDNHSLALMLYQQGIALRFGQHCAMPLLTTLGVKACLRVSLGCYNTEHDVDAFVEALLLALKKSKSQHSDLTPSVIRVTEAQHSAEHELSILDAKNWPEKHRQLLLLSKVLPTLAPELRTPQNEVQGCEARVWIDTVNAAQASAGLYAYADSKVVRGILALVLLKHKALNSEQGRGGASFDYIAYLKNLGLSDYFSAGRKDGIQLIVKRLNTLT